MTDDYVFVCFNPTTDSLLAINTIRVPSFIPHYNYSRVTAMSLFL